MSQQLAAVGPCTYFGAITHKPHRVFALQASKHRCKTPFDSSSALVHIGAVQLPQPTETSKKRGPTWYECSTSATAVTFLCSGLAGPGGAGGAGGGGGLGGAGGPGAGGGGSGCGGGNTPGGFDEPTYVSTPASCHLACETSALSQPSVSNPAHPGVERHASSSAGIAHFSPLPPGTGLWGL